MTNYKVRYHDDEYISEHLLKCGTCLVMGEPDKDGVCKCLSTDEHCPYYNQPVTEETECVRGCWIPCEKADKLLERIDEEYENEYDEEESE